MPRNSDPQLALAREITSCRTQITDCHPNYVYGGPLLTLQTEDHLGQHHLRLGNDGRWFITYVSPAKNKK